MKHGFIKVAAATPRVTVADCKANGEEILRAIREMEKELGISYPTVRARLDQVIAALGIEPAKAADNKPTRKEVLEMLSRGELTQEQAMEMLK